MTLGEAIFLVDELKPNQVETARKIEWLSWLDQRVFVEIICTHQGDENTPENFTGYSQDTDQDTVLLIPAPYDEVYRFYLEMEIDRVNLENDKYNDDALLFNNAWGQFARKYHREHRPLIGQLTHRF